MADFSTTLAWFKPCETLDQIDPTPVVMQPPTDVFEEGGAIKVMEGMARVKVSGGKRIRVDHSIVLPSYANQATVFLNGWEARFDDTDHHLFDVGVIFNRIRV